MRRAPPGSNRTAKLFPYTTLFRSHRRVPVAHLRVIDAHGYVRPAIGDRHLDIAGLGGHPGHRYRAVAVDRRAADPARLDRAIARERRDVGSTLIDLDLETGDRRFQIGRASCSERGCQYF